MNQPPLEIARLAVLRMLRERSNLFFIFAFPILLVLLIGLSFGGGVQPTVTVVGPADASGDLLVEHLRDDAGVDVVRADDREAAIGDLGRGRTDAVIVLPENLAQRLASGQPTEVEVGLREQSQLLLPAIRAAIRATERPHRIQALAEALGAGGQVPSAFATRSPVIEVTSRRVGEADQTFAGLDRFDLGASTQLVLFVFITTLGGASRIVEAKDLGTLRRILSGPVTARQVVLGEGLGRFAVGGVQALWIIFATMLLFGVDWGAPVAAFAVIAAFTAASAGAGLLLGALATTVSQASGLATLLGLTLAALGGSMAPLDIFGSTLRRIAHVTPHAWANDAFAELTRRDGGLGDVLVEVLVLLGFALVLTALAAHRLRRSLTT